MTHDGELRSVQDRRRHPEDNGPKYTVPAACGNCGWSGKLILDYGTEAPSGRLGGKKMTCRRCGVYAVQTRLGE